MRPRRQPPSSDEQQNRQNVTGQVTVRELVAMARTISGHAIRVPGAIYRKLQSVTRARTVMYMAFQQLAALSIKADPELKKSRSQPLPGNSAAKLGLEEGKRRRRQAGSQKTLDEVPLESYRIIEDVDGTVTDYLLPVYALFEEICDLRLYMSGVWREVAYEDLNGAVAATLGDLATAIVKRAESAIMVDFPGHESYETVMRTITRGDIEKVQGKFKMTLYKTSDSGGPAEKMEETSLDIKEYFLTYAYRDLVDFVTDFQATRSGKPTKRMLQEIDKWDPKLDLQRATKEQRHRWRRSYTINWLYDLVNVYSSIVVQRNTMKGEHHAYEKVDWSADGQWSEHVRLFGINEFAGIVTSIAMQKPGTDIKKLINPSLVFQLQCIVDSLMVSRGWSLNSFRGDVLERPMRGFRPRRDVDLFLDRQTERFGKGILQGAYVLQQLLEQDSNPSRHEAHIGVLQGLFWDFRDWLGESKYMSGLATLPPSRFSNSNPNGLWEYSPFLCGAGLAEGLELVYRFGLALWDQMPEPMLTVHLHNMLVQKKYLERPIGLLAALENTFPTAFFADGRVPTSNFTQALSSHIGKTGTHFEQRRRAARKRGANTTHAMLDVAANRFFRTKSNLLVYRESGWNPDRIPDEDLGEHTMLFNFRSRHSNAESFRHETGRFQSLDAGGPHPLYMESDNDPKAALSRPVRPDRLSRRDLLKVIRYDVYSDICGPFPLSSLNYFWVTARMVTLFMMFEDELKRLNNALYHDIYVANSGRGMEKRILLAVAALSGSDEECLRTMAKIMEEQRMGWMQHIYWDDLDTSMDRLYRDLHDAEAPEQNARTLAMGVNGLWTVVQPCARPTNLATLNRKRLAVDASIWIYQFLKAVRDKEGNALRNSHIVGFFRRICKLLWFGIQPVFVFDGGAPALKRATIQKRKQRREGRREDAVRTAGKLLAIQMQRLAEEEEEKRKREKERPRATRVAEEEEVIPDAKDLVYVEEIGMSQQERMRNRKFYKQDAYHLPEIEGGIASMGKPDDPRIMSVEELEEYARQFNNGEDINLYDFSKIDFDGDFFKSLPPPDRYNILNAARLRSRLRMGLSKEQLDDMFPDRMAFSRFQIERVKERNHLTQRLMYEIGMSGTDLTLGVNARIAGERDREYILVKNEGVEGGWALGVVSKDKDIGQAHKPIDVDAVQFHYQTKDEKSEDEEDDDDDFEDVPIEGFNRLPKLPPSNTASLEAAQGLNSRRQQYYASHRQEAVTHEGDDEDSLFVGGRMDLPEASFVDRDGESMHPEEEHDLNYAIALSLQNQHGIGREMEDNVDAEDDSRDKPKWTQVAVEAPKPIGHRSGSMIAHIVNNRANAAVPKRQEAPVAEDKAKDKDSDSDDDMQAILARSRRMKKTQPKPVFENKKNPFDGPLPFPKLDWGSSLFARKKKTREEEPIVVTAGGDGGPDKEEKEEEEALAGGFEVEPQQDDGPKPLPPWLVDDSTDIRDAIKKQQDVDRAINAQDRAEAEEEEKLRRRELRDQLIEIESSDDEEGTKDVNIVEIPPSPEAAPADVNEENKVDLDIKLPIAQPAEEEKEEEKISDESSEPEFEQVPILAAPAAPSVTILEAQETHDSPEPEFEDVQPSDSKLAPGDAQAAAFLTEAAPSGQPPAEAPLGSTTIADEDLFTDDVEYDEFSDPEDEELLAQMAEEAEEHARFASELNNKSTQQNREDYERELRALRNQQKKDRRDADEVTQTMIAECQALLRLFGIPYITAPMEAEAQCAELVRLGMVDGIVTDDSDTFLFGGTRVYKNMFNSNKFVECYIASDLEKEMSLSREQLISLAQLLGSDYTEGLPGVGPVTAVEILSEFPGKDGLVQFREWWKEVQSQTRPKEADASSPFRRKFRKSQATKLFLPLGFPSPAVYEAYLHPMVDSSTEKFQWGVPDVAGLREYLMATIGWGKERTDEVLVPVIRDMNKREIEGTQSNITRFFGGSVGAGARETFAPRQRVQGSKRMAAAVDRLRANVAGEEKEEEEGAGDGSGANKRRRTARQRRA
ncbi:DNA repair protein rad13 [Trichoderma ghanense]|uniref:DNA repair protein rad13 n=1 Tax=Trichoderma ghanense TaxID=65468 RepID=A0ABY2GQS6_9HYPO